MDDTALQIATHEIYSIVELGNAPNGTDPALCGPYGEAVRDVREAYSATFDTTRLLVQHGRTTDDPHSKALERARTTWALYVQQPGNAAPLVEAMRQAVQESARRPRFDLFGILAALEHAPDDAARKRVMTDVIDDVALLRTDEMLRLKDTLRETYTLPATWIKEWTRAVKDAAKARRETLAALVPAETPAEASDDQRATWPYLVRDGRMVFCAQKADMFGGATVAYLPIAEFHAAITEEQVSEDATKVFLIEGETAFGRPFQLTMQAEEFADDKRLKAALTSAAGAQSSIAVGMAKHLGTAIQKLSGQIPSVKRYTRTGWAGDTFLLPGRSLDGMTVALSRKLPYSASPEASLELGLEALEQLLLSHTPQIGGPLMAFLLTPPLARLAAWRNERYGCFASGRTGSLKSSWAQCAMCLYGPDFIRDDLLVKWGQGATNNAIMHMAVSAHDVPFLIDNYKPNTGDGPRAFINLIHNIVEGGEKDRLQRNSELRDARPIFAWPFVTGEDVPDNDPASLARILIVPFVRPEGPVNQHLSRAQELSNHLSAVGMAWITWLESEPGQAAAHKAAERFRFDREAWAKHLLSIRRDMVNVLRVASNLATNGLVWMVLEQHPQIGGIFRKHREAFRQGIGTIANHMAAMTAESLEATRYLMYLRELLQSGEATLVQTTGEVDPFDRPRMIGYSAPDGGAYLLPQVTRARIERHFGKEALSSLSDKTLYSQLEDLGVVVRGKDRTAKPIWVQGKTVRVLHLSAEALADAPMHDDEIEADA
ncbi:MAG TPA: hypothetical protein VFT66_15810 [Roseiflexaceae bacterium]|nr:hypothetical protein [Roseiflexaceae bacterium]